MKITLITMSYKNYKNGMDNAVKLSEQILKRRKQIMKTTKAILILAGALCLLFYPVSSRALTFDLNYEFSEAASPTPPSPWIRLTFMDVSGGVQLTISSLLHASEFVGTKGIMFNLNPSLNANNLAFTYQSGLAATISTTNNNTDNNFKADGDGYYDIKFVWPTASSSVRFDDSDTAVYLIAGITGLSASSFGYFSYPGGGQGEYHAASHIQGITNTGQGTSGWIGDGVPVPEPGILILLGIAMSAIGMASWRISKI